MSGFCFSKDRMVSNKFLELCSIQNEYLWLFEITRRRKNRMSILWMASSFTSTVQTIFHKIPQDIVRFIAEFI